MTDRPDLVYADLSRAGLGNLLFPWARAVLAVHRHAVPMLPPKWLRVRIGPYLRGEMDKREYWKLFGSPTPAQLVRRAQVLRTATLLDESGAVVRSRSGTTVQVFRVIESFFEPLYGHREAVAAELRRIARPGVIGAEPAEDYVAVHVRLGDFVRAQGDEPAGTFNITTPVQWFVDAVTWLRRQGWTGAVVVFSDGTEAELSPLTALPGVRRQPSRNALDDLFRIAGARLLIGSGSSFGAWGAYLGDVPMAVQTGRNTFMPGWPLAHEVGEWTDDAAPGLHAALGLERP